MLPRILQPRRRRGRLLPAVLTVLLLAAAATAAPPPDGGRRLLVRRPLAGPTRLPDGRRVWTWPGGAAVVSDTALSVAAADSLLSLPCTDALRGTSRGRRLLFQQGDYPVDGTLVLADSGFTVVVSRGRLRIAADSLVVAAGPKPPPQAAQLLLLAGIALLTFALLVRSRRRLGAGRP